jgi:hypothetical protein
MSRGHHLRVCSLSTYTFFAILEADIGMKDGGFSFAMRMS